MHEAERVFRFSSMVLALPVGVAIACAAAGIYFLWRRSPSPTWMTCFGVTLFSGAFLAPMLFNDRVVVTPQTIEQTTGFWWSPTVKGFRYADVERVRLTTQRDRKGRSKNVWEVHRRDGSVTVIDPGDLWDVNTDEIVPLLRTHGVRIESDPK